MKTRRIIGCALCLSLLMPAAAWAQSIGKPSGKGNPFDVVIRPRNPKPKPDRPKAPAHNSIDAVYYDGSYQMVFSLSSNVQSLSVEIENQMSGEIHYGSVDVSYPVMDVCLEPASYSITCTAEDGSLYAGEFDIY